MSCAREGSVLRTYKWAAVVGCEREDVPKLPYFGLLTMAVYGIWGRLH